MPPLNCGPVTGDIDIFRVYKFSNFILNVLGYIYQNGGAASPCSSDMESLLEDPRQVANILDQVIMLGNRQGNPGNIGFLKRIGANKRGVLTWPVIRTMGTESM